MRTLSYRLFLLVFATVSLLVGMGGVAYADMAKIRGGDHEGYSRLVIEWPSRVDYNVEQSGQSLTLSFQQSGEIDVAAVNAQGLRNIGAVNVLSAPAQPLTLQINKGAGAKFRDFRIGKRIVIDVYDGGENISAAARQAREPRTSNAKTNKTKTSDVKETSDIGEGAVPPPSDSVLNAGNQQDLTLDGLQPHVITISSTNNVGLGVFQRAGYLWVVMDDPQMRVRPVVSGPQKDKLPAFEEVQMGSGKAYRLEMPEEMFGKMTGADIDKYKIYGEGGGLLWRIILTPNPRRTKAVKPEIKETGVAGAQGNDLLWPLQNVRRVVSVIDPLVGDEIQIATVEDSSQYAGAPRYFVELDTLPSAIGMAVVTKADDVRIARSPEGVVMTRPGGLAVSPKGDFAALALKDDVQQEEEVLSEEEKQKRLSRIFDFTRWEMGGVKALEENRRVIMVGMGPKKGHQKVEDLITLAKLNVANNRGPEALGLLRVAMVELPGIEEGAEYIALRGAAGALSGQADLAIEDLAAPSIQQYDEVGYWKAYALAQLEDWQQADQVMPTDYDLLFEYPRQIRDPLALTLAEVALRAAKVDVAQMLLLSLKDDLKNMGEGQQNSWKYLSGELARQMKKDDDAFALWKELVEGDDDYYRAKAGLSLTRLQLDRQKITPEKAIDRLEGLRYAWRGDELETLINFRLGQVYLQNGDYLKGLSTLRNAIALSPNSIMSQEVTDYMTDIFRDLFSTDKLKEVSALDAVSIYDEFKELTPVGKEGDVFVQQLAERLVDVDLLGRAANLLDHQLTHRVKDADKIPVAIRLAAIRLLDDKPEGALRSLDIAQSEVRKMGGDDARQREIDLLKARAFSKTNQVDRAIEMLEKRGGDPDAMRLKADIAWGANKWADAAAAFQDLLADENISPTRPLNEYQANLILNRAVSLNLSGNRLAITNMRERYGDLMMQTEKARLFDLVTRPRQLGLLGNRESISSLISEVDMFGDFLENYRKMQ